jgi:hypothetical protein
MRGVKFFSYGGECNLKNCPNILIFFFGFAAHRSQIGAKILNAKVEINPLKDSLDSDALQTMKKTDPIKY